MCIGRHKFKYIFPVFLLEIKLEISWQHFIKGMNASFVMYSYSGLLHNVTVDELI